MMKLYRVAVVAPDHLFHRDITVLAKDYAQAEHRALCLCEAGSYISDTSLLTSEATWKSKRKK